MRIPKWSWIFTFATITLLLPLVAQGATIVSGAIQPGGGGGGTVSITTGDAGNDDFQGTGNLNQIEIQKDFGSLVPIDVVFTVENTASSTGTTTEYFVSEDIVNATGFAWVDFHFELGYGTGDQFVQSDNLDFLDFDDTPPESDPANGVNPTPTSDRFSQLMHYSNAIGWWGGTVLPGQSVNFTFSIDVPNFGTVGTNGRTEFTLRQRPSIIPEPGTIFLFGSGLVGAAVWGRRRNRG